MIKTFGILMSAVLLLASCSNTLDHKINKEDFDDVKAEINSNTSYEEMKKKYLIDNISNLLGFAELGKALKISKDKIPTFREQIGELIKDFDSIKNSKLNIRKNNQKIESFIKLKDAESVSIDQYNGYLSMTLDFDNTFDKEILYVILNYKYVNKYDTKFFDKKTKLTDKIAKDFKGEVTVSTNEKYNDVARFMYKDVPVRASKALRDELGDEVANKKVMKEFLMEGLKISTLGIVFKDKTELMYEDADWKYLK